MNRKMIVLSISFVLLASLSYAQDAAAPAEAAPAGRPDAAAPKGQPEAKTQEELDAFMAATSVTDLTAAETAVDDFAKKFPDSELRATAYSGLMQRYQQAGNAAKTIAMGRKAISFDPEHTVSLAVTANALAESTDEKAADKDSNFAEADKDADAAIKSIETGKFVVPQSSPEQFALIQSALLASAHSAKGLVRSKQSDYAGAESELKLATSINKGPADPVALLRLAIAQDHLKKYSEALNSVNAAIVAAEAQKNAAVAELAKKHKLRLTQLAASSGTKKKVVSKK